MKNEKTGKIKTVRGSVLFTTVSVMALLIIFLTGALALASSANNRAHKSYASSQASYNARAAIDSFTQAMVNNVGVAAAVHDMGSAGLHPTLSIDGKAWKKHAEGEEPVANGWGTIGYYDASGKFQEGQIDVQKTDNKEYGWDPKGGENGLGAWIELNQYKITATAKYGKEEETVTAYLKTRIKEEEEVTEIKGLQALGAIDPNSASIVYGGLGLGLNDNESPFSANHLYDGARFATRTELTFVNGSVILGNGNNEFGVYTNKSKTIVLGNFQVNNGGKLIWVDYPEEPKTQKEIPYFFVNGLLEISNSEHFVQTFNSTNGSKPFNIFAGTLNMGSNDSPIVIGSADLYLMDSVSENTYNFHGKTFTKGKNILKGTGTSTLYKWTSNIEGNSNGYEDAVGGSVYCKGDLDLSNITIHGDVRVEGDCSIGAGTTIYGNLVVGGNLTTNGSIVQIVSGMVYAGSITDNSNASTLKAGYEVHENILHNNELRPGYSTASYENEALELTEEIPHKMDHAPWHNVISGAGYDIDVEWRSDPVYWIPGTEEFYDSMMYYLKDIDGNTTDVVVSEPEVEYYFKNEDHSIVNKDEAVKTFYTEWNNPEVETTEPMYYYKQAEDGSLVKLTDKNEAYETGKIQSIENYEHPDAIYPTNMTREKIYGIVNETENPTTHVIEASLVPADSSTKLITTLEEARKALALSATEGSAPDAVYDAEKLLCDRQLATKDEFESFALDMSKFDTYTDANITNGMELKGAKNYYFTGKINKKKFTIFTGSNDINVVLDGVTLGDDETKIVVDTSGDTGGGKGSVTFFVLNGLTLSKGRIINSTLDPDSLPAGQTKPKAKYTDDYGMIFYSDKNTTLHFDSDYSMVSGSFKMPFAHLTSASVSPNATFEYEDEFKHSFGYYSKASNGEARPRIVGNGIFADTKLPNDFLLLYTKTGNNSGMGGGSRVLYSATNDIYELSYYGAA